MSTLSVRLPDSIHKQLAVLAEQEGISINQLVNSAVAEKMSALMTADYLESRAKKGSRNKFSEALSRVANIEPEDFDRLVSVNLSGTANMIRHTVPLMIDAGKGIVVNLSSGWGRSTSPEDGNPPRPRGGNSHQHHDDAWIPQSSRLILSAIALNNSHANSYRTPTQRKTSHWQLLWGHTTCCSPSGSRRCLLFHRGLPRDDHHG